MVQQVICEHSVFPLEVWLWLVDMTPFKSRIASLSYLSPGSGEFLASWWNCHLAFWNIVSENVHWTSCISIFVPGKCYLFVANSAVCHKDNIT